MQIPKIDDIQIKIDSKFYCYFCATELRKDEDFGLGTYEIDSCSCQNAVEFRESLENLEKIQKETSKKLNLLLEKHKNKNLAIIKIKAYTQKINKEYGIHEDIPKK